MRAKHMDPELEGSPGGRGSFRSHEAQEGLEIKQVDEVPGIMESKGSRAKEGALPHHSQRIIEEGRLRRDVQSS